jgi:hypothetical protein
MEPTLPAPIPWRQRLMAGLETPLVQRTLIALILVNAVILGIETSPSAMKHWGVTKASAGDEISRLRNEIAALRKRLGAHRRTAWGAYGKR